MLDDVFVTKFVPNEKSEEFIEFLLGPNFPVFHQMATENGYMQYAHTFVKRDEGNSPRSGQIISDYYFGFVDLFNEFCEQNDIKYHIILRAALNNTTYTEKLIPDIHRDHHFPHKILLMYLNDSEGETLLYDEDTQQVIQRIKPEKYKCVVFSGNPHNNLPPALDQRRVVLVVTFI